MEIGAVGSRQYCHGFYPMGIVICTDPVSDPVPCDLRKLLDWSVNGGALFACDYRVRALAIVTTRADGNSQLPAGPTQPPLDPRSFVPFVSSSIGDAVQNHVGGARFFIVVDEYSMDPRSVGYESIVFVDRGPNGTFRAARGTFQTAQAVLTLLTLAKLPFGHLQKTAYTCRDGIYGKF
ncbi:hypothetical protein PG994_001217 [Apiospora phragmitis]|uniref:Uncharacterized protein n=1 Tax=Apiospora phragmitis TaxID=2905665 RepID=A0ABR1WSW1_9PEZI